MEGDDDYVPFYNNRADVYGRITIAEQVFDLPIIKENDHPVWDPSAGTFTADVGVNPVPIRIEFFEADDGTTGGDDDIHINPADGKNHLDLLFDTCSLRLGGDLPGMTTQNVIDIAGDGSNGGRLRFSVTTADGTPDTAGDIALVELSLVQVIHNASRIVAGKPTVLLARVANNSDVQVNTTLRVKISGQGVDVRDNFPMQLRPGELQKTYFYRDAPLVFPPSPVPYNLAVTATVDDEFSKGLPRGDCRRVNDSVDKPDPVKVVAARPLRLLWAKVGTGLDIGNFVPDQHFDDMKRLGSAYIEAVYPVAEIEWSTSPIPISPPLSTVHDWMTAILSFLPYARSLDPFALVFELNLLSVLSGLDMRILGVLPSHDWFDRYDGWEEVSGVSMGEFAPQAVIFQPRGGASRKPAMTLPAHELGHTFGLSVDSRLKHSWVCGVDWPVVGSLPCGAVGGLDEYKHSDPDLKLGNPSSGFWVRRNDEPPEVLALSDQEQCDSHCFMGKSPAAAHENWTDDGKWIDRADYERLLDLLQRNALPLPLDAHSAGSVHVSGLIGYNDTMYLGPMVLTPTVPPALTGHFGLYAIRLLGEEGNVIAEAGLPIDWNAADYAHPFPVTAFSTTVAYDAKAHALEVINRGTGKRLAKRRLRRSSGRVEFAAPATPNGLQRGDPLEVAWSVVAGTGKETRGAVLISEDGKVWWPATSSVPGGLASVDTSVLRPGRYECRVVVLDGIDLLSSATRTIQVT
jgi:hypothetical protein